MKFEVHSSVSLMFLSIVNLCVSVQDFAEKTLNSLSSELGHQTHIRRHHQQHNPHHHHHHHPHQSPDDGYDDAGKYSMRKYLDNAENFLLVDYLADGEMERRINYNGVAAKGTTLGNSRYIFLMYFLL